MSLLFESQNHLPCTVSPPVLTNTFEHRPGHTGTPHNKLNILLCYNPFMAWVYRTFQNSFIM